MHTSPGDDLPLRVVGPARRNERELERVLDERGGLVGLRRNAAAVEKRGSAHARRV